MPRRCRLLGYEGGRLRMDDRMDAAMSDMDLVPLLIQVLTVFSVCQLNGMRDHLHSWA